MKPTLTNIKKFCIAIILFNCFLSANAQTNEKTLTKLYVQAAAGACTRSGSFTELGLQGVIQNKWSFTLSYHDLMIQPKNLPADYQPGSGIVFFIPYTDKVEVNMKLFSITAGRYFPMGKKSWFSAEGGISIVNGEKATFQRTASQDIGFIFIWGTTSNYTNTIEKKTSVGGMIRADINWAFSRFIGLGMGVFANFNSIQSPIGINMKLSLGAMGRQKKLKARK